MNALKSASPTWHPIAVPTWVKGREASTPLKYYLKQEIRNCKLNWSLTDGKQFCLFRHNKQLPKLSFKLYNVIMTAIDQAPSLFCSSYVILLQQIFRIKLSDKTFQLHPCFRRNSAQGNDRFRHHSCVCKQFPSFLFLNDIAVASCNYTIYCHAD